MNKLQVALAAAALRIARRLLRVEPFTAKLFKFSTCPMTVNPIATMRR
ncbi:MAG: hypothetical protein JF595_00545 [Sphingomonadales bacterium]|nr:hypothetical protein [Sphingomonadales bacterium]